MNTLSTKRRSRFACFALIALTLGTVLATAPTASAQYRRGGFYGGRPYGGFNRGYGYGGGGVYNRGYGYGNGFSNQGYYGGGFAPGLYNRGYYGGGLNIGIGVPQVYGPGYGYGYGGVGGFY